MPPIPTTEKRPFIPVPGVVQVEMVYNLMDVKAENVYHVRVGDGSTEPTLTQMDAIANVFENWESVTMRSSRSTFCALNIVRVRQLGVDAGLVLDHTPVSPVTGTNTAATCPGNVTLAVKWNTGRGGRSYRGRSYFIGMCTNLTLGNQATTTFAAALAGAYNGLLAQVNAVAGNKLVVVSYAHNKFWRDVGVATDITLASVDVNLDSQRRRLSGRGS